MRAVNLLPKDVGRPQRRAPDPLLLVGGGGGLLVVGLLALATMAANSALQEKRDALATAQLRLQVLPEPPPPPSPKDEALAAEQEGRGKALRSALASRISWDRILRRFSLVLPEDVWLTSLAATAPGAATGVAGFTLSGYTYSHDAVARLLARLAVVPDLANVQLRNSTLTEVGGRRVVQFSIVADVKPDQETAA